MGSEKLIKNLRKMGIVVTFCSVMLVFCGVIMALNFERLRFTEKVGCGAIFGAGIALFVLALDYLKGANSRFVKETNGVKPADRIQVAVRNDCDWFFNGYEKGKISDIWHL